MPLAYVLLSLGARPDIPVKPDPIDQAASLSQQRLSRARSARLSGSRRDSGLDFPVQLGDARPDVPVRLGGSQRYSGSLPDVPVAVSWRGVPLHNAGVVQPAQLVQPPLSPTDGDRTWRI